MLSTRLAAHLAHDLHGSRGFTLTELMVAVAVLGVMASVAMPNFKLWLENGRIRTAAESALAGLQLARAEAVRRNASVRFSLVSDLTSACATSASGKSWVVSRDSPATKCDVAPSDTTSPRTVQARGSEEGTASVTVAGKTGSGAGASVVTFSGLGRPNDASPLARIDFDSVNLAAAESKDLRILIESGGQVRLCDPAITSTTDPRRC